MELSELKLGETAQIASFLDDVLAIKLLEMGCLPGTSVRLVQKAPFGGPLCITINDDYQLALRVEEAAKVMLEKSAVAN
jgi:ferrous iron transport protein A